MRDNETRCLLGPVQNAFLLLFLVECTASSWFPISVYDSVNQDDDVDFSVFDAYTVEWIGNVIPNRRRYVSKLMLVFS